MIMITSIIETIKYIYLTISGFIGLKSSMDKLNEIKQKKYKLKNEIQHNKISAVYPIIQETLHSYDQIDRVSIFRSHNGNGIPTIGKQSFTSCIQEVFTKRTTSITNRWQNIPNDELMGNCINSMMNKGYANLPSYSKKCPDGILADFCKGNNIKNVIAVPILFTDTGFIFLNFCSATCEDMENIDGILFEANSCAGRVKLLIEN